MVRIEDVARGRTRSRAMVSSASSARDGGRDGGIGGNSTGDDDRVGGFGDDPSNRSRVHAREGAIGRKSECAASPVNVLDARSNASSESDSPSELDLDEAGSSEKIGAKKTLEGGKTSDIESAHREASMARRLTRPMAPSVDVDGLQKRVSELRVALQTSERMLDRTKGRLELAEGAKRAAESESATLRARVWALEGSGSLVTCRDDEVKLDDVRGRLLREATVELSYAAKATCAADHKIQIARADYKKLQDTVAALSGASSEENDTLSMELAQARMRIRGDAREIAELTERATQAEATANRLKEANDFTNDAIARYQTAEKETRQAKESLVETMRHNEFLQGRVTELEEIIKSDGTSHYDQELRRVREYLEADIARLTAELKQERAARKAVELQLSGAIQTDTLRLPLDNAALASEKSATAELREEIERLKVQLAQNQRAQTKKSRKDDWADALGLRNDDDDEEELDESNEPLSPTGMPLALRDALVEAARLEVEKLGEMNRKLVQAKLTAEKESVSTLEYEAAITRNNEAWAAKLAMIELEATKSREQLVTLTSRGNSLARDLEACQTELDEVKLMNNRLKSSRSASDQDKLSREGSWLNLLPRSTSRKHSSSPDFTELRANTANTNLVSLGSWASLNGLDDDELCCVDDDNEDVTVKTREEPEPDVTSRKRFLEEKSRSIRERLAARSVKPPLSPLKTSEEAIERSIRETRLAVEAMKASRSSLLKTTSNALSDPRAR